jgi:hypothetical protein
MTKMIRAATVGLCLLLWAGILGAAPIATLTFTVPDGTVSPTDSIPVMLTLSLSPLSDALITDSTGQVTSGLTTADIQANLFSGLGVDESGATVANTVSSLNVSFGCSGSFTSSCGQGPPYDFTFGSAMVNPANLNLAPGSATNYLFGTFTPTGGAAPPGTYQFFYSAIYIQVLDPNNFRIPGNPSSGFLQIASVPIADTQSSSSVFTRVVLAATPEPASFAFMLGGLGVMIGLVRRRKA